MQINPNVVKCKICNTPLEFSHLIRTPISTNAIYLCPYMNSFYHDLIEAKK